MHPLLLFGDRKKVANRLRFLSYGTKCELAKIDIAVLELNQKYLIMFSENQFTVQT